jgi:hypothetical protein
MTEVYDSTGTNKVTIHYNDTATTKIDWITDALGYQTTFLYADASNPLRITGVQEPAQFAIPPAQPRTATFAYYPSGQLQAITDEIGIESTFTYSTDGSNFIMSLQTPYGTSQMDRFRASPPVRKPPSKIGCGIPMPGKRTPPMSAQARTHRRLLVCLAIAAPSCRSLNTTPLEGRRKHRPAGARHE